MSTFILQLQSVRERMLEARAQCSFASSSHCTALNLLPSERTAHWSVRPCKFHRKTIEAKGRNNCLAVSWQVTLTVQKSNKKACQENNNKSDAYLLTNWRNVMLRRCCAPRADTSFNQLAIVSVPAPLFNFTLKWILSVQQTTTYACWEG